VADYEDESVTDTRDPAGMAGDGPPPAPFEPDEATAVELARIADCFVERVGDGLALDYSDGSIEAAEAAGVRIYAALSTDLAGDDLRNLQGTLVFELGAYVGETFIRNHGGAWGWAPLARSRAFGLRTDSGLTAFPQTKAKKRLLGNIGSLVAFYSLLVRWPDTAK
jgi:hypothetical protein